MSGIEGRAALKKWLRRLMWHRRYSLAELDRMRSSLYLVHTPMFVAFDPDRVARTVEEELRTHMMNGSDPDELCARLDAQVAESSRRALKAQETERAFLAARETRRDG